MSTVQTGRTTPTVRDDAGMTDHAPSQDGASRVDLTGQRFGELTVLRPVSGGARGPRWECVCSCGNTATVAGARLRRGHTRSCGHLRRPADLTGQVFGELTVQERAANDDWRSARWLCVCSCGSVTTVPGVRLRSGVTRSCGHLRGPVDLTGQVFGELTVQHPADRVPRRGTRWECVCSCGNLTTVYGESLRSGNTRSCGHLQAVKNERPQAAYQARWDAHLRDLVQFRAVHGRLPRLTGVDPAERRLGRWLADHRTAAGGTWRPHLVTPMRRAALDERLPGWLTD